jgi:hypothetical protein
MQNILKLSLVFLLTLGLNACTSSDADKSQDDDTSTESEIAEVASSDKAASDGNDAEEFDDEAEASSNEVAQEEEAQEEEAEEDSFEVAEDDGEKAGEEEQQQEVAQAEPEQTNEPKKDSFAPLNPDEMANLDTPADTSTEMPIEKPAPSFAPLRKVETVPYKSGKVIVNAVYIARPGDTLASVSQKIYGADKTSELKKINPTFARREMTGGDKIYYNSPQRPTDEMQVRLFYEDIGLQPMYYEAQEGDDIRQVGKKLLGHENSWKEIWSTNLDVESKGALVAGTQLRYWGPELGGVSAPAQTIAASEPPPVPQPTEPPLQEFEDVPPPPPAKGMAELPPPPPMEPPPAAEPPPMPPTKADATGGDFITAMAEDPTTLVALAVILITTALLIIIMRKRKSKKNIDFHTATHTQLE